MSDYPVPKLSDSRPFLTLVEREFLSNYGNIPRSIWEPISLMYEESDKAISRVQGLDLEPGLEQVRREVLEKWGRVKGWLDEILLKSQSVDALRSSQMVEALRTPPMPGRSPVSDVVPDSEARRRHGLRRRESK